MFRMISGCFRIAVIFAAVMSASSAYAVQSHGGAEGLVSHQIGHVLFSIGMAYLLYRLYLLKLNSEGWCDFKVFLWLLIAWNVMTFAGHWMDEYVAADKFLRDHTAIRSFKVETFFDAFYYFTRLDHLFLIPSFAFFLIGLKKWRKAQ